MNNVTGVVSNLRNSKNDEHFKLFDLNVETNSGRTTIVPCIGAYDSFLEDGQPVTLTGDFLESDKYGKQFKFSQLKKPPLKDLSFVRRYLRSNALPDITDLRVDSVMKSHGTDALRVLLSSPIEFDLLPGFNFGSMHKMGLLFDVQRNFCKALSYINDVKTVDVDSVVNHIITKYGYTGFKEFSDNPYKLTKVDPIAFDFFTLDGVLKNDTFSDLDPHFRVDACAEYILDRFSKQGHCCYDFDVVADRVKNLLNMSKDQVIKMLDESVSDGRLFVEPVNDKMMLYTKEMYDLESDCAKRLGSLISHKENYNTNVADYVDKIIEKRGVALDSLQREAVISAATNGVSIITGGPGTGKTTVIDTITDYFESMGYKVSLAAPTGKASKRLQGSTGHKASTMQRLLNVTVNDKGDYVYQHNDLNPIDSDVIIIDEASMLDIDVTDSFLKAVKPTSKLVFVGDVDQLPSISPGSVLKDMIDSNVVAVTKLSKVYRQSENSNIIITANNINSGEHVHIADNGSGFSLFSRDFNEYNVVAMQAQNLIDKKHIPGKYVQVLTPTRKGPYGSDRLNVDLQGIFNPPDPDKSELISGGRLFRQGDRVIQLKNDYNKDYFELESVGGGKHAVAGRGKGVFNGDVGVITSIKDGVVSVFFESDDDDEPSHGVRYTVDDLSSLDLAYAMTIHKSQGSEYPIVIMPFVNEVADNDQFYTRNLLYTGITRGKNHVYVYSTEDIVNKIVDNDYSGDRKTGLAMQIMREVKASDSEFLDLPVKERSYSGRLSLSEHLQKEAMAERPAFSL